MASQTNGGLPVPGNLNVMGDTDLNGDLNVDGAATIAGAAVVSGALTGLEKHTAASADGAVTIQPGTVIFTKAGVCAATLAAPSAAQAGTRMTFLAGTANAHTITATGLIEDGVTGGAKTTATFAAFVGSSLTLEAYNLKWLVVGKNACTIT